MSTSTETETTTGTEYQPPQGTFIGDTWVNFKRWTRKTVRKRSVIAAMILQPIIWIILFTQIFQDVVRLPGFETESYLAFFLPAVMIFLGQFSAATAGVGLIEDIESGMFEKVLTTPVSRTSVFLGKSLADLLRVVLQVLIILVIGYGLGARVEAGLLGALGLIGVALLFSVLFIGLSTIIGLYTQDSEATQLGVQFLGFPMMFLSSAFFPLELLPSWIQVIARINPITYGIDAARAIMLTGWVWETILPAVGVLVALDLVFGAGAVYMLGRAADAG